MAPYETATLTRDCEATRIPYGDKLTLHKGTLVEISQSLGGTLELGIGHLLPLQLARLGVP